MSYMEKRQNPLTSCPTEEIESAFAKVDLYFGSEWLNDGAGEHPLQLLWKRRDALATNELFAFGRSLLAAEQASTDWLNGQVKLVRGKDENNQRGAVFEILAVGYAASRQSITPAPANQPGYDIDIETPMGTSYRASLKRYSQSTHERLFRKKSAVAEKQFLKALDQSGINALLYIEAKDYPNESDWQKLYSKVYELASEFRGSRTIVDIENRWIVGFLPLEVDSQQKLDTTKVSYSFVCTSPYHTNEQSNFLSKLETACSNLERHVPSTSELHPIIMMQLPVTASASTLAGWAKDYLKTNQSSTVQAVFFLQPYIANNEGKSSSYIAHFVSSAVSSSFVAKCKERLEFEVPVGIITTQPPEWAIQGDIDEKRLPDQYVYQQGKHYILASEGGEGGVSANIAQKAPGIESIAVFKVNGQELVLGGRWGADLCLIGG